MIHQDRINWLAIAIGLAIAATYYWPWLPWPIRAIAFFFSNWAQVGL